MDFELWLDGPEVDIEIDSLTDCLKERSTGRNIETVYNLVTEPISKAEARAMQKDGWNFDWSIPFEKGYNVYALKLEGNDRIEGLIAMKNRPNEYFMYVDLIESAPHNRGHEGEYQGVGGHLFAIACKLSFEAGNDGYVQFISKTNLIKHYEDAVNAQNVFGQTMIIDTLGALNLVNTYFK